MSRLYDRFRAFGASPGWVDDKSEDILGRIAEGDRWYGLPRAVPIDVSNVLAYVYEVRTEDSIPGDSMFNVAPPFEYMFLEARVPPIMQTPDGAIEQGSGPRRYGLYVGSADYSNSETPEEDIRAELRDWKCRGVDTEDLTGARWILRCRAYLEYAKGDIYGPAGLAFVVVRADGSMVSFGNDGDESCRNDGYFINTLGMVPHVDGVEYFDEADVAGSLRDDILDPMLYSLVFMHAKNSILQDHAPPEKSSRKHLKRYGVPLTTYKTLEIAALKEALRRDGQVDELGLKRALHICRGHFATYSEDKPLFGKYSGTFWKPQHVKGNKKHGEVVKDYAVKAPVGPA